MMQINLLPWREQEKEARKVRFFANLAGFIGFSLLFLVILHFYIDHDINHQLLRNAYLQSEMNQEQQNLAALKKMVQDQASFEDQLHFIIKLREQSLQVVRLLDLLTKTIPDTVSLDKVMRQGNVITITGETPSNLEITAFMKNLSQFPYFTQPVLTQITGQTEKKDEENQSFELKMSQKE